MKIGHHDISPQYTYRGRVSLRARVFRRDRDFERVRGIGGLGLGLALVFSFLLL